jgi:hypothetical protein
MAISSTSTGSPVSSCRWRVGLPSPSSINFQAPLSSRPAWPSSTSARGACQSERGEGSSRGGATALNCRC